MKKKPPKSLVEAAETITQDELCQAPELTTLVTLDATLMAAMIAIEFNYPHLGNPEFRRRETPDCVEEYFLDSIFNLATALRSNLHGYYATIQTNCDSPEQEHEAPF